MTFCEPWGYCPLRHILQKGFGSTIGVKFAVCNIAVRPHYIMVLDLRDVFAKVRSISLNCDLPFDDYTVYGDNPVSNLHFIGSIENRADVVTLSGKATYTYTAPCDRCAEVASKAYSLDINHIIVNELSNDDADEEIVVTENMSLELDELIRSDVILNLPTKFLCRDDCKGVCPGCGKRLNFEECVCKPEIDPRLEKLSEFFSDDTEDND